MDPSLEVIAAVRDLLPWWAAAGNLGPMLLAALACGFAAPWLSTVVATVPLYRLAPDAPWYERARAAAPAQFVSGLGLVMPGVAFAVLARLTASPLSGVSPGVTFAAVMTAGSVGGIWNRWRLQRALHRDARSLGTALRVDGFLVLLLLPHLLVVAAMAFTLRAPLDLLDLVIVIASALGMAAASWWGGLPLLRVLGGAWGAPEPLRAQVHAAADRLGLPRPEVDVVAWPVANAFAFPLTQRLCLTEGILDALDDEELSAILAHELGHLSESPAGRAVRFASGFVLFPFGLAPLLIAVYGPVGLVVPVALLLAAAVGIGHFARRMEKRADHVAHADEQEPGLYARALERLYRVNLTPVVTDQARAPHPHLYDRLLAAGVSPDYPRPAPPSRGLKLVGTVASIALVMTSVVILMLAPVIHARLSDDHVVTWSLSIALSGGLAPGHLLSLAYALDADGRREDAIMVARAAATVAPEDPAPLAYESSLWSQLDRCATAAERFEEAARRVPEDDPHGWLGSARAWLEHCRQRADAASAT